MSHNTSSDNQGPIILSNTEEIGGKSIMSAYLSDNLLIFSDDFFLFINKKSKKPATSGTKKSIYKPIQHVNIDTSFSPAEIWVRKKQMLEKTSQKWVKIIRGSLLLGSLNAIIQELKKTIYNNLKRFKKRKNNKK